MDDNKTSFERTILLATSIVGGIGALFAAINSLSDTVRKTVGILSGFDEWQLWGAALALCAISLWLFRLSRRRSSVLLHPEALSLDRRNPAHLVGRADDIDQLARLCREESLIFLEGESGAGKSALLQCGLVPALKDYPGLLPIYVESLVGSDWERDPRAFLATALWSALNEDSRKVLQLETVPSVDAVRAVLEAIPVKLGGTPLILLDQFDDYQLRHRERFLSRKAWLKPGKLSGQNGFWRDIQELLLDKKIHLVIVTRTDTAGGLTSVMFTEPETYRLDRLSVRFVGPLLDKLTKEQGERKVIADPEFGWTSLLVRLSGDLERSGTVLPQQLKIVLAGLGTLPGRILTVAAYERIGATAGLEARFIEDRVGKTARLHAVSVDRIRAALLTLVDSITGQKTVERGATQLSSSVDPAAPAKAEAALNQLALDEVLRRRVDPGTGESFWLLDHDYLARAVLQADRLANRWRRTLVEGIQALNEAGQSWRRWWRALLPPTTQLVFLYDRLRGRFMYGEYRTYAIKSLLRFIPSLAVSFIIVILFLFEKERLFEESTSTSANSLLNRLEFSKGISSSDFAGLLRLASADEAVRQRALTLVLTDSDRSRVFVRQPEVTLRAIIGVSPRFRAVAASKIGKVTATTLPRLMPVRDALEAGLPLSDASLNALLDARKLPIEDEMLLAIAGGAVFTGQPRTLPLSWLLSVLTVMHFTRFESDNGLDVLRPALAAQLTNLDSDHGKDAVKQLLVASKLTYQHDVHDLLRKELKAVCEKLKRSDGQLEWVVLGRFLKAIDTAVQLSEYDDLDPALGILLSGLGRDDAQAAVDVIVTAIKRTQNPYALWSLARALKALTPNLSESQAAIALKPFFVALAGTKDPPKLRALGFGLSNVPATLTDAQAKDAIAPFLDAVKNATNRSAIQDYIGEGLHAISAKLGDRKSADVILPFLATIKSVKDPYALAALGLGLGTFAAALNESQAKETVDTFLSAIEGVGDQDSLYVVAEGLRAILGKFSDSSAKQAIESILAAVKRSANPHALGVLAEALGAFPAALSQNQAPQVIEPLLAAMKDAKQTERLKMLSRGLAVLPVKLDDFQAKRAIQAFVINIESAKDENFRDALGEALEVVLAKLSDGQAQGIIFEGLQGTRNALVLGVFGAAASGLAPPLSDNQTAQAIEVLLAALKETKDFSSLKAIEPGVKALSAKLGGSRAEAELRVFLDAINGTESYRALDILHDGLTVLVAKFDSKQAQALIRLFLDIKLQTHRHDAWNVRGDVLAALTAKLDAKQAQAEIEHVLDAIKATDAVKTASIEMQVQRDYALSSLGQGLKILAANISDKEGQALVRPFLDTLRAVQVARAFQVLGEGLGALATKLNAEQANEAMYAFVRHLQGGYVDAYAAGLSAILAKLDPQSLMAAEAAVYAELHKEEPLARAEFAVLAPLYAELVQDRDEQVVRIFNLLRDPRSSGETTQKLLALLEHVPNVQTRFEGDLWRAVEWAEVEQKAGRLKTLDLDAPLKMP